MRSWLEPAAWTNAALRWRWPAALLATGVTAVAVLGLLRLDTAVGYRAFLGSRHPAVVDFDAFVERFGGGLPLLAVWSCESGGACASALDDASLAMAADVAASLSTEQTILRSETPADAPILVRPLIGLPTSRTLTDDGKVAADVDQLRRQALADPTWVRRLVSEDGRSGAIILHLRDSASATAESAFAALRAAVRPWEERGFAFSFVGGPVEFVVAGADLADSTRRIIPLMVALIAVALMVLFGAPAAAVAALLSVGLALVWSLGLMGWLGWSQNSLTQVLPPLILVVGVCDAIHLLGRFAARSAAARGDAAMACNAAASGDPAMRGAAADVGAACAMTSFTTIAGFGSLAVSDLESIARFGVIAAVGVFASLVTTFTVLPLLVCRLPAAWFATGGRSRRWSVLLRVVARFATGRARPWILAAAVLAGLLGTVGARDLRVDASFEDLYGEGSDVVRWAAATSRQLRAPDTLEIALQAPAGSAGIPVEGFAAADRIQQRLSAIEGLGRSLSIVDVLRHLNRLLHRDELPLPSTAGGEDEKGRPSSVYRLLRSRDPAVTDDLVDSERPALRISVESAKLPQEQLRELLVAVQRIVDSELPAGWSAVITGPVPVVSRMIDAIRTTQLESFAMAAVAVFGLVAVFFRSLRLGAVAMVPTLLPVVVTLGVMGWLGIALDVGSAMVASVVLGLAVDDAIHLLAVYRHARRVGHGTRSATRRALLRTGRAVVTTSVALAVGFATLSLSTWHSIASFGIISSIAVLVALLAALFVLPALTARR